MLPLKNTWLTQIDKKFTENTLVFLIFGDIIGKLRKTSMTCAPLFAGSGKSGKIGSLKSGIWINF